MNKFFTKDFYKFTLGFLGLLALALLLIVGVQLAHEGQAEPSFNLPATTTEQTQTEGDGMQSENYQIRDQQVGPQ